MRTCTACTFPNNHDGAANCGFCNSMNLGPAGQPGNPAWVPPAQQQPQGFGPPPAAHGAANLGAPQQAQGHQGAPPAQQPLVVRQGIGTGALVAAALVAALGTGGIVYGLTRPTNPLPPPGGPERRPTPPDEPHTPRTPDVAGGGNGPLINGPLVTNNGGGCCGGNGGPATTQLVPVRTPVSLQIPTAWLQSGQPFATRLPSGQWVTIRSNPATGQIETRPTQPPAQQQLQGQQGGGAQQPPAQPNPPAAPAQPPVTRRIVFPFV